MFGNMQFARRVAESTNDKNQRDLCPRDVFFTLRDDVFKQIVKLQLADQLQREPRSTELELILDTNIRRVDLDPLRLKFVLMIEELQLRIKRLLLAFCRSLDTDAFGFLELAKPSNRPLSRPTFRSIGLDQRPIRLTLSVDVSVAWPDEHARIIVNRNASSNANLSTTTRSALFKVESEPETNRFALR